MAKVCHGNDCLLQLPRVTAHNVLCFSRYLSNEALLLATIKAVLGTNYALASQQEVIRGQHAWANGLQMNSPLASCFVVFLNCVGDAGTKESFRQNALHAASCVWRLSREDCASVCATLQIYPSHERVG